MEPIGPVPFDYKTAFYITIGISLVGALLSALKVVRETGKPIDFLIAFLTAVLSVAHFFQPRAATQALAEKEPPKATGATTIHVLFSLVGVLVAGSFALSGLWAYALLTVGVWAVVLATARRMRPHGVLVLALLVGGGGCAYLSAAGAAVKACTAETYAASHLSDLEPIVSKALTLDWPSCFAELEKLAVTKGSAEVSCVVEKMRAYFAAQVPAADAGTSAAQARALIEPAPTAHERAVSNADEWLKRHR